MAEQALSRFHQASLRCQHRVEWGHPSLFTARRQRGVALSQAWSNPQGTGPDSSLLAWPQLTKRAGEWERKPGQATSREMIHEQSDSGNDLCGFFWEAVGADRSSHTYFEMRAVTARSLQEAFHRHFMS